MRLHPGPFEKVENGSKVIEIRLNDEKRQVLKVGDQIEFISRKEPEKKILVEITDLKHFSSFKDLCYAFPPIEYGSGNPEEYTLMYEHYSKEDELKYGVVAIRFIRLSR